MIRCYVTDRRQGNLLANIRTAIQDRVDLIQIREKDLAGRDLYELACTIRDMSSGTSSKILVNDRLDVALAARLDGIHLPADGLPISRVRPFIGFIGRSTHSREEAMEAERAGADYVVFGPVFSTPGKTPVGVAALREVVRAVKIPVLAIGGITEENTGEVVQVGAAGIAAIRLFQKD